MAARNPPASASGPNSGFRRRGGDDDEDEDMDMGEDMFDEDDMEADEEQAAGLVAAELEENSYEQLLQMGGVDLWRRPDLPPVDPKKDSIAIQFVEADYVVMKASEEQQRLYGNRLNTNPRAAVIRCYGVTDNGNSVCAWIHGFDSYFYVPCWSGFAPDDLRLFGDTLNTQLRDNCKERDLQRFILNLEIVQRQSVWGYQGNKKHNFIKITVALPSLVATARRLLENGLVLGAYGRQKFQTYESNIAYVLRWMIDLDVRGGGWLELPAGSYGVRSRLEHRTYSQLEVDISSSKVVVHSSEGEWNRIAPMRILSFDIECAGRKGHFPEAHVDPVIQIANVVQIQGQSKPIIKNVFTLKSCASIAGCQVISSEEEADMLMQWLKFFRTVDADVVTGYNIINFDLPYLLERAEALKLDKFPFLGRVIGSHTTMKEKTFSSKAFGTRDNKDLKIDGRVQFDVLMIMRREYKLRSYSLNSVCAEFLGQQKEDVHYSIITDLQNGNEETRRRLAIYCVKDAWLPLKLIDKLLLMINYVEMARVTGVPLSFLLFRGQQIKVVSQLYRKCRASDMVVPVRSGGGGEDKFEGATVIEPTRGFYNVPIATLDFASLYPSIMMAHNLCFSTLVSSQQAAQMDPADYVRTPTGDCFVRAGLTRGLLPEILEEILAARKQAKKEMEAAEDPMLRAVLNGRQLALKISANSVYGFTGAQRGALPCLEISSSVTAFGRVMIEHTKATVEKIFTVANGYSADAEVIYGDTDSVMVKFGVDTVEEAMKLGQEAAQIVSKEFKAPIKLEFEKVYFPYLLMNKKRYAGLYWSRPHIWDKMDTKGIETVRRDNCGLVKEVVETCLRTILIERNVQSAIDYTKSVIADLLQNRVDLSMLVISKSLGKGSNIEDYSSKVAHVYLADRMRKRDPASAPVAGDRVAYVIIKGSKAGAPLYERVEDPIYVLEHNLPIDTSYYVENQLKKPLTRIFEPILSDMRKLFAGEHTRSIKVASGSSNFGGIMSFAVKERSCLGCKTGLKESEKNVCAYCFKDQASLYMVQVARVQEHEEVHAQLWTQCQRCQGSLHQEVLCTSRDCPIFYRRKKVQKDLQEAQELLESFEF